MRTPPHRPQAGLGAGKRPLASRPIRTVLRWQALATLAGAALAAALGGSNAAWSAAAGGAIVWVSTVVYALVLGMGDRSRAERSLVTMMRAEGAKILVIVAGLFAVLRLFSGVVTVALFATFVVTVLLASVALLARE